MRSSFDPDFVDFLMWIENGKEPTNSRNEDQIPKPMLVRYTTMEESIEELMKYVYLDMNLFERNLFQMMQRVILCPKNKFVDDITSKVIKRIPGQEMVYISDDRAKSAMDQDDYIDYINSLCNGTRLICKQLTPNVVGAVIATGQFRGKHVWISRILLEPNSFDNKYLIPFVRHQLPLRMCFTIDFLAKASWT
ncbi:hypothetical protein LIER_30877 [Lithospermum erythrorhizon]|uniref:DNA helicase n=1 Tax=Lithospermum erythrorhizon TaxID=34254 RepID=A0AAV3RQ65_LITER